MNLGSGMEISIKDLVHLIAWLTSLRRRLCGIPASPMGSPGCLDTSKVEKLFGFRARTPFEEGLRKTIEWYLATRELGYVALKAAGIEYGNVLERYNPQGWRRNPAAAVDL